MGDTTDYRKLLLQFIGSLTICDHIGDVTNEIDTVLKKLGMPLPADVATDTDWGVALGEWLGKQGVPFFFKGWGEWAPWGSADGSPKWYSEGKKASWPDGTCSLRVGKKTAGRKLDGKLWEEYPSA